MKNALSLYYENGPQTPERFEALVGDIEDTIWDTLTEEESDLVKSMKGGYKIVTLDVLENAICRTKEEISRMRNGKSKITADTMRMLEFLHARVKDHPDLARKAIRDHFQREGVLD